MNVKVKTAEGLYRPYNGLGLWPYRGKVAAVGIGHSPTARRWRGTAETSLGAWTILAIRKAVADAGVSPSEIDCLVLARGSSTGSPWPDGEPLPGDFRSAFVATDDPLDGLAQLSPEWILANMPELGNVQLVVVTPADMSYVLAAAAEVVGAGLARTAVGVKGWHNFAGRYNHGDAQAAATVSGPAKWSDSLAGPGVFWAAQQFQRYMYKYGKTHEMLAPFVVNSKRNGLLFPEGYWAQHRPTPLTIEEYNAARWIAKPANLYDNDLPIHTSAAYLLTSAERARDLRQRPVYVLGHAAIGDVSGFKLRTERRGGVVETLEEAEDSAFAAAERTYEAAGISPESLDFENLYDGFSLFHPFLIEGFRYAGIGRGEALDLFQTDITIDGPNPVSPSGGNIGSGRTRFWMHTDSIQQIQRRAGARQIGKDANIGVSGGPTTSYANFLVWSADSD